MLYLLSFGVKTCLAKLSDIFHNYSICIFIDYTRINCSRSSKASYAVQMAQWLRFSDCSALKDHSVLQPCLPTCVFLEAVQGLLCAHLLSQHAAGTQDSWEHHRQHALPSKKWLNKSIWKDWRKLRNLWRTGKALRRKEKPTKKKHEDGQRDLFKFQRPIPVWLCR